MQFKDVKGLGLNKADRVPVRESDALGDAKLIADLKEEMK